MIVVELTVDKDRYTHRATAIWGDEVYSAKSDTRSPIPVLLRMVKDAGCDESEYCDVTREGRSILAQPVTISYFTKSDWRDSQNGLRKTKYVPFGGIST